MRPTSTPTNATFGNVIVVPAKSRESSNGVSATSAHNPYDGRRSVTTTVVANSATKITADQGSSATGAANRSTTG